MNRRQKREMSKNLGIMQYQAKLPLTKKLELMRENIASGKRTQAENTEEVRRSIQQQLEEKQSASIYSMAEHISKNKGIPMIDAMEEAEKLLASTTKK